MFKTRIMTPGPTQLLPEAQAAMAGPIPHHRTEAFRKIFSETRTLLQYFFDTQQDVLILASSGTGAMEGAMANLLSPGDRALIISAGKFGERWTSIAQAYSINADVISVPYGETFDLRTVEERLEANPQIKAVFVQATESSTGVRHDIERLGAIVSGRPQTCLVVDAITGLGVMEVATDQWHLDLVIGGSQKATMLPPGLAFVSVSKKAWAMIRESKSPRYYFDFQKELKSQTKGESAFTPAISLVIGLHTALEQIRAYGRDRLIANAALLASASRVALQALGLKLFARSSPSDALTTVCAPPGIDSGEIVKAFKDQFGIVLANGQGEMQGKIFRIAHLGYYDFYDAIATIACLEIILKQMGVAIELGAGVQAAQRAFLNHPRP
ncbi:MAG: alanine--glyoxylate aminotransferase family protein [Acidobacteriia bacterium]|nr:alanine--glyoxylate aminotransferase family protein [Terriglobia bacterium]